MGEITTVGLDLAKRVISLHAEDASARVVLRRTLKREAVLGWFAQRPACVVAMEACASAHHFARELTALGHTPRIIAAEFVRPYRMSGKNDANDAQAICAAVRQPQMRFVTAKSAEQQARLAVHRLRQGLQEERTAGLNRLRGLLAEFGRVYANSASAAVAGARAALADETLPATLRQCVARQLTHLRELDTHLADCDREVARDAQADPCAQRVVRLSGVGVLTASAIAATVVDAQQFRCGRQFAAWLGLTPRQFSTGGRRVLDASPDAAMRICARCSCRVRARRCKPRYERRRHDERGWPRGSSPPMRASAITRRWWRSPTSTPD